MQRKTLLFVVGSILLASEIQSISGCTKKFSNEPVIAKAVQDCFTKLSLTAEDLPKVEDFGTAGFDDKCFGKCVLAGLELISESGSLDRDTMIDMIEEQAPKQMVNKLTEAVTKCSESSGVLKVESKDDCKPFAVFNGCYMTSTEKLC